MLKAKETEQFIPHMLSNTYLMLLANMYILTFAENVKEQLTSWEATQHFSLWPEFYIWSNVPPWGFKGNKLNTQCLNPCVFSNILVVNNEELGTFLPTYMEKLKYLVGRWCPSKKQLLHIYHALVNWAVVLCEELNSKRQASVKLIIIITVVVII